MEVKRVLTILTSIPGWLVLSGIMLAGYQHPMPIEIQLTHTPKGHTLNNTQVFSPDDQ